MLRSLPMCPVFGHRAGARRQTGESRIEVGAPCRLAEEYVAAGRDLCAMGLIKPVAILSPWRTWFALRRESLLREKTYFEHQSRLHPDSLETFLSAVVLIIPRLCFLEVR